MEGRCRICLNLLQNLIKTKMARISLLFHDSDSFTVYPGRARVGGNDSPHFQKGVLRIKERPFRITRNEVVHAASRSVLVWVFTACACSLSASSPACLPQSWLPACLTASPGHSCSHGASLLPGKRSTLSLPRRGTYQISPRLRGKQRL